MTRACPTFVACLAAALGQAARASADEPTLLQRQGPASLWTAVPAKNGQLVLKFTDVLSLRVEVLGDGRLEVQPPERWTEGPWHVRADGAAALRTLEDGRRQWSQTLLVEPLAPGEAMLLLAPLRVRVSEEPFASIRWQPIAVQVTSRLTQPDAKSLRDITAIEELPPQTTGENNWRIILLAVVAGIGLALAAGIVLWRRQATPRHTTTEAWALFELTRLQSLQLPERGKSERFGTLLAGLLRRYLEKKHQLPVRRQTTREFLESVTTQPELSDQRAFLEAFLQRCDILKFAPVSESVDECHRLAEQLRCFLTAPAPREVTR